MNICLQIHTWLEVHRHPATTFDSRNPNCRPHLCTLLFLPPVHLIGAHRWCKTKGISLCLPMELCLWELGERMTFWCDDHSKQLSVWALRSPDSLPLGEYLGTVPSTLVPFGTISAQNELCHGPRLPAMRVPGLVIWFLNRQYTDCFPWWLHQFPFPSTVHKHPLFSQPCQLLLSHLFL